MISSRVLDWSCRSSTVSITRWSGAMARGVPYHTLPEPGEARLDHRDPRDAPDRALTAARPAVTVPVMRIEVHDNQVESALKTMKKLMLKDGLFKEMKKREF